MNPFLEYRQALKSAVVAADIGLSADQVIIDRQIDLFNGLARVLGHAKNGICLVIQVPEGKRHDDPGALDFDCTITLSLIVKPSFRPGDLNEETVFLKLVKLAEGWKNATTGPLWDHCNFAMRVQGFGEVEDPQQTYLIRQILCRQRILV